MRRTLALLCTLSLVALVLAVLALLSAALHGGRAGWIVFGYGMSGAVLALLINLVSEG